MNPANNITMSVILAIPETPLAEAVRLTMYRDHNDRPTGVTIDFPEGWEEEDKRDVLNVLSYTITQLERTYNATRSQTARRKKILGIF